ncbi:SRPBCC domain-containing protein [Nocardia carnea]|uniref:SRPBCC domain-containing protein n=1 Tax=Nocardia carnea TaxID=37328 RepID=UPI002453F6EE|nr:SRPBCC domain-containing protein [Nocardia carnea]
MSDSLALETTRVIGAPIARVWDAWHDPRKMAKWWGPSDFHSTVNELDVRAGGRFDVVMHGPDGTDYPNIYLFDRVVPPTQLVYTNIGSKQFGLAAFQSIVDLEALGDRTRVTLRSFFSSAEDKRKHVEDFHAIEGARQLLQRLEEQAVATD